LSEYNKHTAKKEWAGILLPVNGKITIETLDEKQVAYVRHTGTYETLAKEYSGLIQMLYSAVGAPVAAARAGLEQAGVPAEMARLYGEMYAGIANGLVAFERPQEVTRGSTPLVDALRALV
jgi:hypothetical protein